MTDCDRVSSRDFAERRQGERRQVYHQTFQWCARFVGVVVILTSAISIGSAVSISSFLAERSTAGVAAEHRSLRYQFEALIRRVEELEQLESHRHRWQ